MLARSAEDAWASPWSLAYKAQVVDNVDGVILDHSVEIGDPVDAPQLVPAIDRIGRRTGSTPRAVTAPNLANVQATSGATNTVPSW